MPFPYVAVAPLGDSEQDVTDPGCPLELETAVCNLSL